MRVHVFGSGIIAQGFSRGLLRRDHVMSASDTPTHDAREVWDALGGARLDTVLDCSELRDAYACERGPQEAFARNVLGPLTLAEYCAETGISLTRVTSGHIYEGDVCGWPHGEAAVPTYCKSVHSRTVAMAQQLLPTDALQLRIGSIVMGERHPENLLTHLADCGYGGIVPESVITLDDLVRTGITLITQRATGAYNVANPGGMSEKDIMQEYRRLVDPAARFEALNPVGIGYANPLRTYCVLGTEKLEAARIVLPCARDAVRECCEDYFLGLLSGT